MLEIMVNVNLVLISVYIFVHSIRIVHLTLLCFVCLFFFHCSVRKNLLVQETN